MNSSISKQTITEFIGGSEQAFTKIYWAYYPSALLLGRRLFHDHDLAKDFVQDLFARVWEKRENFKGVEDVRLYIYKMAWMLAVNKQEKATSRSRLLKRYFLERKEPNATELEFPYTDKDYKEMLEQALASMSSRGQKIFRLKQQGFSRTQIAAQLNLAQNIVDNDLSSAMKAVRTFVRTHVTSVLIVASAGLPFLF